MPIYEYACSKCYSTFEALVRSADDKVSCPKCGGKRLVKQFSVPAAHTARSQQLPICGGMPGEGCNPAACGMGGQCPLE